MALPYAAFRAVPCFRVNTLPPYDKRFEFSRIYAHPSLCARDGCGHRTPNPPAARWHSASGCSAHASVGGGRGTGRMVPVAISEGKLHLRGVGGRSNRANEIPDRLFWCGPFGRRDGWWPPHGCRRFHQDCYHVAESPNESFGRDGRRPVAGARPLLDLHFSRRVTHAGACVQRPPTS